MEIRTAEELAKRFTNISDAELSLADMRWLVTNIKSLVANADVRIQCPKCGEILER